MFTGCYLDPEDHVWLNRNAVAGHRDLFELHFEDQRFDGLGEGKWDS